jgi:16S rRNA G966 N2-methylase RsmD
VDKEIQNFINQNIHSTAVDVILQSSKYPQWDMKFIAQQLTGKQIARKKLPTWFENDSILFPHRLPLEQCSSELTANYKSALVSKGTGIDLTGGFGVDVFAFSKNSLKVLYCERDKKLANLVQSNLKVLKALNVEVFIGDGIDCLKTQNKLDWIFVDPVRRKEGARVYRLEDCAPNLIELQDLLFLKANRIIIKTAPLLDIQQTIKDLNFVKEVHVVSVNNDCKEVLYVLEKDFIGEVQIIACNIKKLRNENFNFNYEEERNTLTKYAKPLNYLYEPNASIMKAGGFKSVADQFNIFKLHKHSHLYTSKKLLDNFPGRRFKINSVLIADKKAVLKNKASKANLACRNFPQKVEVLKKKLNIMDGGELYVFATTLSDAEPRLILCEKIEL